ncbi:uncharacterized protein BX664DRAFT_311965 [Halteromyces radiatus]|uniref:uncharacterized protein n=1 Tax=Halteromyces radiatus TaxID=101107 RepID=UPI00221FB733|nr:uncharacterized protein BX664DRAFT_311965 [Halteromyces radiatus]KAI8097091.1 hypothetical protein BX664DRAFT_311965 [Halteromyces radiatus]
MWTPTHRRIIYLLRGNLLLVLDSKYLNGCLNFEEWWYRVILPMTSTSNQAESSFSGQQQQQQQQQDLSGSESPLEPFYAELLSLSFTDSATAIKQCRSLCAQYGFTVKQEASTHRNIYVYCSREGLPDSLRNPKVNPQRKRPSKRCDCRWRVVLYERKGKWEFRKSLNPDAAKHNHELMRPEEIEKSWPKEVNELICELARLRLPTQEIRSRVKSQFDNITWNERRFYNRLSDERQKIKYREAEQRAKHLTGIWTKICMASAGHEELSDYVEEDMIKLLQVICKSANIDESTLNVPSSLTSSQSESNLDNTATSDSRIPVETNVESSSSSSSSSLAPSNVISPYSTTPFTRFVGESQSSSKSSSKGKAPDTNNNNNNNNNNNKPVEPPKGYITVNIPQHSYFVKIHTQRAGSSGHVSIPISSTSDTTEVMTRNPRRTRSSSTDTTARKTARKVKSRSQITSSTSPQNTLHIEHVINNPLQHLHGQSSLETHQHHGTAHQLSSITDESSMHTPSQTYTFVYHTDFGNQGLPLDTTGLSPYVPFQNTYNIPTSTGEFTSDISFQFDPDSPTPISGSNNNNEPGRSTNDNPTNSNEPTIHPAQLYSTNLSHTDSDAKMTPQQQRTSSSVDTTRNLNSQQYTPSFVPSYPSSSNSPSTHNATPFPAHQLNTPSGNDIHAQQPQHHRTETGTTLSTGKESSTSIEK